MGFVWVCGAPKAASHLPVRSFHANPATNGGPSLLHCPGSHTARPSSRPSPLPPNLKPQEQAKLVGEALDLNFQMVY